MQTAPDNAAEPPQTIGRARPARQETLPARPGGNGDQSVSSGVVS